MKYSLYIAHARLMLSFMALIHIRHSSLSNACYSLQSYLGKLVYAPYFGALPILKATSPKKCSSIICLLAPRAAASFSLNVLHSSRLVEVYSMSACISMQNTAHAEARIFLMRGAICKLCTWWCHSAYKGERASKLVTFLPSFHS